MLTSLLLVLLDQTATGVKSSVELWSEANPPESLDRQDRWLCYGVKSIDPVLLRLRDVRRNSRESAGLTPTMNQISRWIGQIPTDRPVEKELRSFLGVLKPGKWPSTKAGSTKWFHIRDNTCHGIDETDEEAFKKFSNLARRTNGKVTASLYLQVIKTEDGLLLQWATFDQAGFAVENERMRTRDFDLSLDIPGEDVDLGKPEQITSADLVSGAVQPEPSAKLFPLDEVIRSGFDRFVFDRVKFSRGTAVLFRASDWNSVRSRGGLVADRLNELGYRKYRQGEHQVILPPMISRSDERGLAESQLRALNSSDTVRKMQRYQAWLGASKIVTYERLGNWLGAIVCLQRGSPPLEETYPFWELFREFPFKQSKKPIVVNLLGSPWGTMADRDLEKVMFTSAFGVGTRENIGAMPEEPACGYHFSALGEDHCSKMSYHMSNSVRLRFPKSKVLGALSPEAFARNYLALADAQSLMETQVELIDGGELNFSVYTIKGLEYRSTVFIEGGNSSVTRWQDLPSQVSESFLAARKRMLEESLGSKPPP